MHKLRFLKLQESKLAISCSINCLIIIIISSSSSCIIIIIIITEV